jgi:hypothetical protein
MTPEERLAVFVELCDLTDSIVNARPDAEPPARAGRALARERGAVEALDGSEPWMASALW